MKDVFRQMFQVRNVLAHTTLLDYSEEKIKVAMTRYINFMELFDGDRSDINEAKEFRATLINPEHANPIRIPEPVSVQPKPAEVRVAAQPIKAMAQPFAEGTIVHKSSDPSQMGPIMQIRGEGDKAEYSVWVNNRGETL